MLFRWDCWRGVNGSDSHGYSLNADGLERSGRGVEVALIVAIAMVTVYPIFHPKISSTTTQSLITFLDHNFTLNFSSDLLY